jgi:GNAT superfamily N-acetyltransferase
MAWYQTIPHGAKIPMIFRTATPVDLIPMVQMLADDVLGALRENAALPLACGYIEAFEHIQNDPNNELVVAEHAGQVIAMTQLTYIPHLISQGTWRCLIEGVRVHSSCRGKGVGHDLFSWVIDRAKQRGCHWVQLTSDKQRPDALRFYENLGFVASHEGFKLKL